VGLLTADDPRDTPVAWLFVTVQFALLVVIAVAPPGEAWTTPTWLATAAYWLQLVGVAALVIGIVNLGRSATPLPSPITHGVLREGGLYRFVRHPIYSGVLALSIGAAIRSSSVVVALAAAALVVWLSVKARWEEARLARRYPGYAAYAARTPRFVPFARLGRRPR
jgi:protein-S-isoprenylcysteine O-methyltransferase Ste14